MLAVTPNHRLGGKLEVGTSLKKQGLRNNEYYEMQGVFDDLYERGLKNENFYKLYEKVVDKNNIRLAYRNIKNNKGSYTAGTDKRTIADVNQIDLDSYIYTIQRKFENYTPKSVRRVMIPKPNGKLRPLGIPCIDDRIMQQCIKQVLEPICESKFHNQSYGFRPNRSTEHAIAKAMSYMNVYKLHYVVDIDIKGFFDNVNHGKLLKQIWHLGIRDKKILYLISKILKSPIEGEDPTGKGTPQGGIISPLLSNIVLNELDWWISSQWEDMPTKHRYSTKNSRNGAKNRALKTTKLKEVYIVRYADDFKIFCRNDKDAFKIFNAVKKWLKERLDLDISPEKSKVTNLRKNYTEFLGFKLKVWKKGKKYVCKSHMTEKSQEKVIENLKTKIKKLQNNLKVSVVNELNATILGVHNYYKIATGVNKDFHRIKFLVEFVLDQRLGYHISHKLVMSNAYKEFYGKYNFKPRTVCGVSIYPLGGVTTRNAMHFKNGICDYTKEGRELIHKELGLKKIVSKLSKSKQDSIQLADNKISLYIGQRGLCAVTKQILEIGDMECHHIIAKEQGGTDQYDNLIWIKKDVHKLIHAKYKGKCLEIIERMVLDKDGLNKVNHYRKLVGNPII